jgi:hypothetical protein
LAHKSGARRSRPRGITKANVGLDKQL